MILPMPLPPGTRLGPYEIVSPLGAGGMGEVYAATDTRLDRTVAVKVLPQAHTDDPDRQQRFEREARAVAALSHPNICALFDIGRDGNTPFLVMEYLEGETLADRIARGGRRTGSGSRSVAAPATPHTSGSSPDGAAKAPTGQPLPVAETVRIATALAEALAAAHKAGIVHRDLKPGNVMLTKSGVKVLDFGLARALGRNSEADLGADLTMTATTPLTGVGSLLGTMPYMAPEQVEGREADARSDIFALGSVIYEMATGRRAFDAPSQAGLIAAILERQPEPISALAPITPPALGHIVSTCLEKDPDQRWQHASDIARQLAWITTDSGTQSPTGVAGAGLSGATAPSALASTSRGASWPTVAITIASLAFAAFVVWSGLRARGATSGRVAGSIEFTVGVPGAMLTEASISPDGRTLALIGLGDDGQAGFWLRRLESTVATEMAGLEGIITNSPPIWSPDGAELSVMTAQGRVIARVDGGPARVLSSQDRRMNQLRTWAPGGVLVGGWTDGLWTFDLAANALTQLSGNLALHPRALADGRRFLYSAPAEAGASTNPLGVYVSSIDAPGDRRLVIDGASKVDVDEGHLLFVRDGTLFAQPFDEGAAEVSDAPEAVIDGVFFFKPNGTAGFDAAGGNIVYSTPRPDETPTWYGRDGRELGTLATTSGLFDGVDISPDGRRMVISRLDRRTGTGDLWLFDVDGGAPRRLTTDAGSESSMRWAPDSRRLVYGSDSTGPPDVFLLDVDTGSAPTRVFATSGVDYPKGMAAERERRGADHG